MLTLTILACIAMIILGVKQISDGVQGLAEIRQERKMMKEQEKEA